MLTLFIKFFQNHIYKYIIKFTINDIAFFIFLILIIFLLFWEIFNIIIFLYYNKVNLDLFYFIKIFKNFMENFILLNAVYSFFLIIKKHFTKSFNLIFFIDDLILKILNYIFIYILVILVPWEYFNFIIKPIIIFNQNLTSYYDYYLILKKLCFSYIIGTLIFFQFYSLYFFIFRPFFFNIYSFFIICFFYKEYQEILNQTLIVAFCIWGHLFLLTYLVPIEFVLLQFLFINFVFMDFKYHIKIMKHKNEIPFYELYIFLLPYLKKRDVFYIILISGTVFTCLFAYKKKISFSQFMHNIIQLFFS
jgi:hypothetical protein